MKQVKKQWVRPQLVILSKGKPEEAVLLDCKYGSASKSGRRCDRNDNTCRNSTRS